MFKYLKLIYDRQYFFPDWFIGVWINPFFIIRRRIILGIKELSTEFIGGKLLDIGSKSNPYRSLFSVDEYVSFDLYKSASNIGLSGVNWFDSVSKIPSDDKEFDWVFSCEMFEYDFDLNLFLDEIHRVLCDGGKIAFKCPFIWDERAPPYDYSKYSAFTIRNLLERHDFEVVRFIKSANYFETIMQQLSSYIAQYCLPRNSYIRIIMYPICVSPFNIMGCFLGRFLPENRSAYQYNFVVARKKV